MDDVMLDVRTAWRRLMGTPAFTVAAVLTLGLAIGATVAVFAVVNHVVLDPLPYPQSHRLIQMDHGSGRLNIASGIGMTSGLYYQYTRARSLDGVAIYRTGETTIASGEPERIQAVRTSPTLLHVLHVTPAFGRWFSEKESEPGSPAV